MRKMPLLLLLLAALIISACDPGASSDPAAGNAGSQAASGGNFGSTLTWDRSAATVIVRMDTSGGTGDRSLDLNALPFCVIYGDGHILWLEPSASEELVLEGYLDDPALRGFLEYIIGSGFYSWTEEGYVLPTPPSENEFRPGPILEQITLTLYGETRTLDARVNWPAGMFQNILERCQSLATERAVYVPAGVWVSALEIEMRNNVPSLPWSLFAENYPEISLADIPPENPVWATDELGVFAWQTAREGRTQITHDGRAYRLIAQDPVLHADAPPAPGNETAAPPADDSAQ